MALDLNKLEKQVDDILSQETKESMSKWLEEKRKPKLILELSKEETRGLLNCLIRTSAKGKDLDISEKIEEKLINFLKENE